MEKNTMLKEALDFISANERSHRTPDGGMAIVVPTGYNMQKLPPVEPPLPRIRQSPVFHDRDSFIGYVNRFKTPNMQLFAEPGFINSSGAHITAVFDYHDPSGVPDRLAHCATYKPRYSEQWTRWASVCQGPLKQAEFAEFVEEARADILVPEAAQLLDIVRTFKASKKVEFDSVVYQPNGDVRLGYDERTQQNGSSGVLPETMRIGIPVYFRGTNYAVQVFVRYRVGGGAVQFQLKMDRADVIEDAAFGEITTTVAEATGIAVYLGQR